MKLTLVRKTKAAFSTTGELYVDGKFLCYTLELPVIDGLPGSAIPEGTYPVVLAPSPKFLSSTDDWVLGYAQLIPHVYQIPDRTNILMHWGNTARDTEGCILVGTNFGMNFIGSSREAFTNLWNAIETPARSNDCTLTVQSVPLTTADLSLQGDV